MEEYKPNINENFVWRDLEQKNAYDFLTESSIYNLTNRIAELAKNGINEEAELSNINNNYLEDEKFADWYFEPIVELSMFKGDIKKKYEKEVGNLNDGEEKNYKEFWIKEIDRYQKALYNDPLNEIRENVMLKVEDLRNKNNKPSSSELPDFRLN